MDAKVGDTIVVESEKVGLSAREGEILEVIASPYGTRFRVRWADGHESDIRPTAGSARIIAPKRHGKKSKAGARR